MISKRQPTRGTSLHAHAATHIHIHVCTHTRTSTSTHEHTPCTEFVDVTRVLTDDFFGPLLQDVGQGFWDADLLRAVQRLYVHTHDVSQAEFHSMQFTRRRTMLL